MAIKHFETIFVSPDGRIRAGWRILMQIILSLLFLIPLQLLAAQFGGRNMQIVAGGIAITLAIWTAAWILDKRPITDFGLRMNTQWWKDCLVGFLVASVVMFLMVLGMWLLGWAEFSGFGWNRTSDRSFLWMLGGYVVTMALVGFYEELWARGYQLKNMTEGFYTGRNRYVAGLIAIGISSLAFGALHLGNPNVTFLGILVIVLAGVMLALPYVVTGQLGYSVGLHFAWNVVQGAVFGLPVSGNLFRQSVLQLQVTGPELWTGGRFGPEGGFFGIIGVVLIVIFMIAWLRIRGYSMTISKELTRPPSPKHT